MKIKIPVTVPRGAGVGDYSSGGRGGGAIFLASSKTAPAPSAVLTLMRKTAKRSISMILRKNRGL